MISALYRYPKAERRAVAREWSRRAAVKRRAACAERGPDAETLAWRAKQDRRGLPVLTIYSAGTVCTVAHSVAGRSDQFDVMLNGSLWRTCGRRFLPIWARLNTRHDT